jgi:hypothetical protein
MLEKNIFFVLPKQTEWKKPTRTCRCSIKDFIISFISHSSSFQRVIIMNTQETRTPFTNTIQKSSIAQKRIQIDLDEIKNDSQNSSIIFADTVDGNVLHVEAAIFGPMSTPYENAILLVDVKFSEQYPVR